VGGLGGLGELRVGDDSDGEDHEAGGQQPSGAPPPFDIILPHTRVKIRGLVSAVQHNDEMGTVVDFDRGRGRYTVQLKDGNTLALKPQNILQIVTNCTIVGIQSEASLNGQKGTIFHWDESKQRYSIRLESRRTLAVRPSNVVLPQGTRVCVGGAEHNGKWGCIQDIDQGSGRCVVQIGPRQSIKTEFADVRV
jgi:hypothetical protein